MLSKDLLSTLSNNLTKVFTGPLLLVCIPLYLTSIEQGYWYTFISIAALSVFADLGFSMIVLQFSAHEFAYCKFTENKELIGDHYHIWKLSSFFRFTLKWLIKTICIVFPIIIIGGYIFLSLKEESIHWEIPWVIYASSSAGVFFNSTLLSFFEGCNCVAITQKCRMYITMVMSVVTLIVLLFGGGLYALAFSLMFSFFAGLILIYKYFKSFVVFLWNSSRAGCYSWKNEFNSLIWRYAISWCCGYFIFQLFTPIAFKYYGAIFAGKIGISIAMWTAGFTIANSWLTSVTPKLNMLVSEKKWKQLNYVFNKSINLAIITMGIGESLFFIFWYLMSDSINFFHRILSVQSMIILGICWLCQVYINGLAVYLRAHKKEPMMLISLFSAFYVSMATLICATYLPEDYLFLGFFSSYIYGIPITYCLYRKQKVQDQIN